MNISNQWIFADNTLYTQVKFLNFTECIAFMIKVAFAAEKLDHHPKWTNTWNSLEIWLCTHSTGNTVTDKDYQLAHIIDNLLDRSFVD